VFVKGGKFVPASTKHRQEGRSLAYTLQMAIDSLGEYEGLYDVAWTAALLRLQDANSKGPGALRAEASRLREAFYIYADGFEYGRP
jgi:hypothetical protein